MRTMNFFCFLAGCICSIQMAFSQSVAINTDGSTANASSILEIKSTTKGLLIPRMLKSQRNAISSPSTGLMVFQTGPDSTGFYMYNGTSWDWALTTGNTSSSSAGWSLTGNSGTTPASNFLGTTDAQPLRFRVSNGWSGAIDLSDNTSFGVNAGKNVSSGQDNVAIGANALVANTTGTGITAVGSNAQLSGSSGTNNTIIGYNASVSNGLTNATAIGYNASATASNSIILGNGSASVGIGTTNPQYMLHVGGAACFYKGANTHTGWFYNATSNIDGIELVANGTNDAYASIQRGDFGYCLHLGKGSSAVNQGILGFYVNGSDIGHVDCNVSGTSVGYYTTSDERLKENISSTQFGLEKLMMIKVADYNYKADAKKVTETGFLAQQLYTIYPQAVKQGGDDAKANPWTIDYGKVTPILVKAVQDQQLIIQKQDAKIADMEQEIRKLKQLMEQVIANR